MENLETPSSSTYTKSHLSQPGVNGHNSPTKGLKELFMTGTEEFPNKLKNKLTLQEKEANVGPREPASDSKIGQRVLAIRKPHFSHTHEIASADFNTLQYDIVSTFEIADLDD